MPIYAYRCTNCGFEKDFLQKMSDKPLTKCPQCGKDALVKELSAPGFELRGTGWAATDFNGGHKALPGSYTHLRAHETKANLVCRHLLQKKKTARTKIQ